MNPTARSAENLLDPIGAFRWIVAAAWAIPVVPLLGMLYHRQLIGVTLIILCVALLIRFHDTAMFALRTVDPWIWILMGFTLLSVTWSPVPIVSVKRAIQELTVPLLGIAMLARGYSASWLATNLRYTATGLLLLSIFVCVWLPSYGIDPGFGGGERWVGVMNSKNQLGRLCLLCAVCWAFTLRGDNIRPSWRILFVMLSIITLVFAKNATSMVVMAGILLFYGIARTANKGWMPVWILSFASILTIGHVLAVTFGYPASSDIVATATGIVGRDSDLTGRADLWAHMWSEFLKSPWIGKGYSAAFAAEETGAGIDYVNDNGWEPNHGHSSYIDILTGVGVVGFALWSIVILGHIRRLLILNRTRPDAASFHAALLICILGCSFFSTIIYRGLSGPWNIILWVSLIEVGYLTASQRNIVPHWRTSLSTST